MIGSLYSGISGLKANTSAMAVMVQEMVGLFLLISLKEMLERIYLNLYGDAIIKESYV